MNTAPDFLTDSITDADPYSLVERPDSRGNPAWLLSVLLHSAILASTFFVLHKFSQGGSKVENRAGGIVLVDARSTTTEYLSEGEVDSASAKSSKSQSPPPMPSKELPPSLPGMAASETAVTGAGEDLAAELSSEGSMLDGPSGANRPLGGQMTTEVFGVKGTGSRFVYVFDRSDSMEGYEGRPLRAAKGQLRKSIQSLGGSQQFQIVFYNDKTKTFKPDPGAAALVLGTDENKHRADRFIQSISGSGGTDHLTALKAAFAFGPDVIFMLTDAEGGFTSAELSAISSWNRSGAVINAIEFGVGSKHNSDQTLRRLARQSGGEYVYKNVLTFRE